MQWIAVCRRWLHERRGEERSGAEERQTLQWERTDGFSTISNIVADCQCVGDMMITIMMARPGEKRIEKEKKGEEKRGRREAEEEEAGGERVRSKWSAVCPAMAVRTVSFPNRGTCSGSCIQTPGGISMCCGRNQQRQEEEQEEGQEEEQMQQV